MLEGITVLNQTDIMETIPGFIGLVVIIMLGCVLCLALPCQFEPWTVPAGICISVMVTVLLVTVFDIPTMQPSGYYKYECTIDESVSMTEVYERYEVIEQRGDIWVLEDKE